MENFCFLSEKLLKLFVLNLEHKISHFYLIYINFISHDFIPQYAFLIMFVP